MDLSRLEKRIELRNGTATISSTTLSDADTQKIRAAYERTSPEFVLARTNMAAGYTLLSVADASHTFGAAGVRWNFTLIYSGEE